MKRVDADEHDSNLFQDENLPTTAGTLIEETWLNSQQEEGCHVVEYAGVNLDGNYDNQLVLGLNHWGPAVFMRVDSGNDEGPFVPQGPLPGGSGTFWVTQTAGLTGSFSSGNVWIQSGSTDRLRQMGINSDYLLANGYNSHTFTASRDTYVAVKTDEALIELNEVGNGAGAPSPTSGYQNVLKVVTDGTDITGVEALWPAFPHLQCFALDIGDIVETARKTGDSQGFRWFFTLASDNVMELIPFEGASLRESAWIVTDEQATGATQEWRGDFLWTPSEHSDASRRWRTHLGSLAERTRYIDDRSFAYEHDGGAVWETAATYTLPHDGATVKLMCNAIDESDNTRRFGFCGEYLLCKANSTTLVIRENPVGTAGINARVETDGTDIIVEASGEAGPETWHFTGKVEIVPMDNSPV